MHVGTVVDVLWTEKDLVGTNWDPGWYCREAQRYEEDDDKIFVFHFKDHAVYSLNMPMTLFVQLKASNGCCLNNSLKRH